MVCGSSINDFNSHSCDGWFSSFKLIDTHYRIDDDDDFDAQVMEIHSENCSEYNTEIGPQPFKVLKVT